MKTAIITGASSGMGKLFALEICKHYVHIEEIWLIARRTKELQSLKKQLENLGKKKIIRDFSWDLTKDESLDAFEKELKDRKPEVCILVNCAGYGKIGSFEEVGYHHNRGMVKLNCQALTDITCLTLPYMRNRGRIIQLASSAAFVPQPDFAVYAASKSYVLSLSRALNKELSNRNICVTAVCPGPVQTEFFDIAQEGTGRSLKRIKMLVMAKPEKVVRKALNDSRKGKEKSVYGGVMNLFELLCKVVPHSIILKFM